MAGFHHVADKVLIIEGFFKILINVSTVRVQNIDNVVQLAIDTA